MCPVVVYKIKLSVTADQECPVEEVTSTSTFRSIVSSYPGKLVLTSIQCPNPDFNKPKNRWKMVQHSLISSPSDQLKQALKLAPRLLDVYFTMALHDVNHCQAWLESEKDTRLGDWKAAEIEILNVFQLLTTKLFVYLMSADVARGHGGDGGGDDRPPPYQIPTGCEGCLGKGTRKPNLGGRRTGRMHTHQETQNLRLKAITVKNGLGVAVALPFLALNAAGAEGEVVAKIGTQFDLRTHMESDRWSKIYVDIQQHLQKIYNGKKAALKERYWVPNEDETYDVERIRRGRPSHISEVDWDAQYCVLE
nr:phosphoglycerate kinase, cytosolic-like isoform X1 [Tanacetum cinerariifolium]